MTNTFRDLTNKLLRRLNESEISVSDFASVQGVHALAKDAILASVDEINQMDREWPFNSTSTSQTLTAGQEVYTWPSDFQAVDWDSFYIQKSSSPNTNTIRLRRINKDVWYRRYREIDYDSESTGVAVPRFVFKYGTGYGVTPSPNAAYTLYYNYFSFPTRMSAYDDTTTIPDRFDWVIVDGAIYYMNLFRENESTADRMEAKFKKSMKTMRSLLINVPDKMEDTRVNF